MWFRLAALWGCTLREAQARCNSAEFAEWIAFYNLEPWGRLPQDLSAGIIAAAVVNANPYRNGDPVAPSDMMPDRTTRYIDPDVLAAEKQQALVEKINHYFSMGAMDPPQTPAPGD